MQLPLKPCANKYVHYQNLAAQTFFCMSDSLPPLFRNVQNLCSDGRISVFWVKVPRGRLTGLTFSLNDLHPADRCKTVSANERPS